MNESVLKNCTFIVYVKTVNLQIFLSKLKFHWKLRTEAEIFFCEVVNYFLDVNLLSKCFSKFKKKLDFKTFK